MSYIAFDWDGTLQKTGIDEPTPLVSYAKWIIDSGGEVRIITARVNSKMPPEIIKAHTDHIKDRCVKWLGRAIPVQAEKDNDMVLLYDDKAVSVQAETGKIFGGPPIVWDPAPPVGVAPQLV